MEWRKIIALVRDSSTTIENEQDRRELLNLFYRLERKKMEREINGKKTSRLDRRMDEADGEQ